MDGQCGNEVPVTAMHVGCHEKGVPKCFCSCFYCGFEKWTHSIIVQQGRRIIFRTLVYQIVFVNAYRNHIITAAVGSDSSCLCQPHYCPFGEALKVPGIQRGIRENHHHARAVRIKQVVRVFRTGPETVLPQQLSGMDAVNLEYSSIVALDQHSYRVASQVFRQYTRRCSDATLPAEAYRSCTGSHASLFNRTSWQKLK